MGGGGGGGGRAGAIPPHTHTHTHTHWHGSFLTPCHTEALAQARAACQGGGGGPSFHQPSCTEVQVRAPPPLRQAARRPMLAFLYKMATPPTPIPPHRHTHTHAHPSRGLCLKEGGAPPPLLNAPPSTLPEGTSTTPIPPPPAFPTASNCPPATDFTARPNRFVTALSWPPERPPLQANHSPSPSLSLLSSDTLAPPPSRGPQGACARPVSA